MAGRQLPDDGDGLREDYQAAWDRLAAIGHRADGTTERLAWSAEDLAARAWFEAEAVARGMPTETDRNGNQWAWWPAPGPGAVATGSHLDTVPGGGAFDGALGVVSAFLAIDAIRARGARPRRPIVIAAFAEEEGGRFGAATLGSRLSAGVLDRADLAARTDPVGVTFDDAVRSVGVDPMGMGPDRERLAGLRAYVELHVEQGRALGPLGRPIGLGTGIDPHGRWRFTLEGRADHAGTARLADRHDPTLALADVIRAARRNARQLGAVATVGKVIFEPNGANVIPGRVIAWLDARGADEDTVRTLVASLERTVARSARRDGVSYRLIEESWTPAVGFDGPLSDRIEGVLRTAGIEAPRLSTAAGHDAGVLAATMPVAMLFVRNPDGISHAAAETASVDDAMMGVRALVAVLEDLAG